MVDCCVCGGRVFAGRMSICRLVWIVVVEELSKQEKKQITDTGIHRTQSASGCTIILQCKIRSFTTF